VSSNNTSARKYPSGLHLSNGPVQKVGYTFYLHQVTPFVKHQKTVISCESFLNKPNQIKPSFTNLNKKLGLECHRNWARMACKKGGPE
jgi:hypothetical protein